jgi:hypothetical protein
MDLILGKAQAVDWLTDERWIVFSFSDGFPQYLEQLYFTPGTPKTEEFGVMAATVIINGLNGIAPFYRIKDSVENRESLRAALAEFNDKPLLTLAAFDRSIEHYRDCIRKIVLPTLR